MKVISKIAILALITGSLAAIPTASNAGEVDRRIYPVSSVTSEASCYMSFWTKPDANKGKKKKLQVKHRTRWTIGQDSYGVGYKRREWTQASTFIDDKPVTAVSTVKWTLYKNNRIAQSDSKGFVNPLEFHTPGMMFPDVTEYHGSPWYPVYKDLEDRMKVSAVLGFHFVYPDSRNYPQRDTCSTSTYHKGFRYVPA